MRPPPPRRLLITAYCLLLISCAPTVEPLNSPRRPTPTPLIVVGVVRPTNTPYVEPTPAGPPTPVPDASLGISQTLGIYVPVQDAEGSQAMAFATLRDFADPAGVYRSAWWFAGDGGADIYEVLAVVFYTEGNLNVKVQQAVAARYLWYCGGMRTTCGGKQLVAFLSYFQPWREPWMAGERFTSDKAQDFLPFAEELVNQRSGVLTALIPGADKYVRDPNGLETRAPIDWPNTPFHFANVHPTWDTYLRQALGRGSNGANRLWVLTLAEASQVCPSEFVCDNMTQEKR